AQRDVKQQKTLTDDGSKTDEKLTELTKAVAAHQKTAPQAALAQTLALGDARKTHVMIRGDFLRPGIEVEPGSPAVLPPLKTDGERGVSTPRSPTRFDLAKWLVDPANPLTARVTV